MPEDITYDLAVVGGGLAVLYLTIAIAFHDYHIFNQTVAFIIMVIISDFSDSEEDANQGEIDIEIETEESPGIFSFVM